MFVTGNVTSLLWHMQNFLELPLQAMIDEFQVQLPHFEHGFGALVSYWLRVRAIFQISVMIPSG